MCNKCGVDNVKINEVKYLETRSLGGDITQDINSKWMMFECPVCKDRHTIVIYN